MPRALSRTRLLLVAPLVASGALVACSDPADAVGFDEPDPAARLRAIRQVAQEGNEDSRAVRRLIELLDSDDPAERFLAIHTLQGMTGQTFGYQHSAPPAEREAAAQAWAEWYSARYSGVEGTP